MRKAGTVFQQNAHPKAKIQPLSGLQRFELNMQYGKAKDRHFTGCTSGMCILPGMTVDMGRIFIILL